MTSWNQYQKNIFDKLTDGEGHLTVVALAGTGKTTTIQEAANRCQDSGKQLLTAFNRPIADALQKKLPRDAEAKTLHGLGAAALNASGMKFDIQKEKGYDVARDVGANTHRSVVAAIKKGASMCKAQLAQTKEEIIDVLDAYNIDAFPYVVDERLAEMVSAAMDKAREIEHVIDFDDMVWLPVVLDLEPRRKYDRIYIDEAQDMNVGQMRLVMKFVGPNTRVSVVGDPKQAIYAWRGADSESMGNVSKELGCSTLPLSLTYRCAKAIVREANTIVPELECAADAPEGKVEDITNDKMLELAGPGDFVIGRSNAAVISTCLRLLRMGKRATIQGQDLSERLRGLITRFKVDEVKELTTKVQEWRKAEVARRIERDKPYQHITDAADCLEVFAEGAKSVTEVLERVRKCFSEGIGGCVVVSTAHRVKGLERDRVFILADTFLRKRAVKDADGKTVDWDLLQEEKNLYYVATTRAKSELYLVAKRNET